MTGAKELQGLLGLKTPAVAITFEEAAPAGAPRVSAAAASSCTYWKQAAEGRTFYTEAPDHYNCPIGAYTHGVDLPAAQTQELEGVVGTMVSLGYLRAEEVPGIPRRGEGFGVAVYAPLEEALGEPDLVLVRCNARQFMVLQEAVQAAGIGGPARMMGRPTCAALPEALRTQQAVASVGCIGNRVYTEMADDELYFIFPAKDLEAVVRELATLVHANQELEKYHRARLPQKV